MTLGVTIRPVAAEDKQGKLLGSVPLKMDKQGVGDVDNSEVWDSVVGGTAKQLHSK